MRYMWSSVDQYQDCSVKLSWVTLSDWWHGNWPLLTKIRDLTTRTQCSWINHWHWDSSLHLQNLTNDNTPDFPSLQLYLSLQARVTFYASLAFNATLAFSVVTAPSVLVGGYLCVSDVSPVSQVSHVQVSCSSVHSTQLSCYTSTTLITSLTPVHQHSSD